MAEDNIHRAHLKGAEVLANRHVNKVSDIVMQMMMMLLLLCCKVAVNVIT